MAHAQAVGGTVVDSTGSVTPGTTIEVRSPALITDVRTSVTDGNGQYLIVSLPVGVYTVTATLPGFSTAVREGVELTTGFTANIDFTLEVGEVTETIVVTTPTPDIDLQSVRGTATLDRELIEAAPTIRSYESLALLTPGVNVNPGPLTAMPVDTGGLGGTTSSTLSAYGSLGTDGEVMIDGMSINSPSTEGSPALTPLDAGIAEYVLDFSGNPAEIETGGVRMNMVPREGSNTFSGGFFGTFADPGWLANNIDQEHIDRGLRGGKDGGVAIDQSWMVAPSLGGPLVEDRLWFFGTYSFKRGSMQPAGLFNNADPAGVAYVPDLDSPAVNRSDNSQTSVRLTWQAAAKDKVTGYYSFAENNVTNRLAGPVLDPRFISPEASGFTEAPSHLTQVTWVRPQTNRILFEAGFSYMPTTNPIVPDPDTGVRDDLYANFERTTQEFTRNPGWIFGGTGVEFKYRNTSYRGSMSYVTGTHNLKVGVQHDRRYAKESYISGNGWTNQVTLRGFPVSARFVTRPPVTNQARMTGIYAQDQWSLDRVTLNLGLRFDHFVGSYPDHVTEPNVWAPEPRMFEGMQVANWKDLQPRLGLVYDVFGDGETAVKVSFSRYTNRNGILLAQDVNPAGTDTYNFMDRIWSDGLVPGLPCIPWAGDPTGTSCVAGDGIVQGDPLSPGASGEIYGALIGRDLFNPGFASPDITNIIDPATAFGWGSRAANYEFALSVEQQLRSGMTVGVGFFRRNFVNNSELTNIGLDVYQDASNNPEDWDEWTFTAPLDPALPGGGGYDLTFVDLNPAAAAVQPQLVRKRADDIVDGGVQSTWQGVDVNFNVRLAGVLFQGGYTTGKFTEDACNLYAAAPEVPGGRSAGGIGIAAVLAAEFCRNEQPWQQQGSLVGSYTFPYDILVSGTFFSRVGTPRQVTIPFPTEVATAQLGRAPTSVATNINLIQSEREYGDRLNQMDLRFGKRFNVGGNARVTANLDIHNLFNANAVSQESYNFLADYLRPTALQAGRMFKVTAQLDF